MILPKRMLINKKRFLVCSLVLLALLSGGFMLAKNYFFPASGPTVSDAVYNGSRLNVLLLGTDAREGDDGNTDTMLLASIDTKSRKVDLLSIPRDTRVKIPGHGWNKINSAMAYGGPELSVRMVSDLLGIPLRYYVLSNFAGFKEIVDTLGGVTIDVEQNMYHDDENGLGINLKKGVQRLNGEKALQYVRYRGYAMADIGRTQHQQKFLMALAHEMFQAGTILKLPTLVPEINRCVKTNLGTGTGDLYQLATAVSKLKDENMIAQTLPGQPVTIDGISYWAVDPSNARLVLAKLFNGETVEVVQNTPIDPKLIGVASLTPTPTPPETPSVEDKTKSLPDSAQNGADKASKPGENIKPGSADGKLPANSVVITPIGSNTVSPTGTTGKPGIGSPGTSSSGTGTSSNASIGGSLGSGTNGNTGSSSSSGPTIGGTTGSGTKAGTTHI